MPQEYVGNSAKAYGGIRLEASQEIGRPSSPNSVAAALEDLSRGGDVLEKVIAGLEVRLAAVLVPGPPTGAEIERDVAGSCPLAAGLYTYGAQLRRCVNRLQSITERLAL